MRLQSQDWKRLQVPSVQPLDTLSLDPWTSGGNVWESLGAAPGGHYAGALQLAGAGRDLGSACGRSRRSSSQMPRRGRTLSAQPAKRKCCFSQNKQGLGCLNRGCVGLVLTGDAAGLSTNWTGACWTLPVSPPLPDNTGGLGSSSQTRGFQAQLLVHLHSAGCRGTHGCWVQGSERCCFLLSGWQVWGGSWMVIVARWPNPSGPALASPALEPTPVSAMSCAIGSHPGLLRGRLGFCVTLLRTPMRKLKD